MDALDLFRSEPATYRGCLWLYGSTKGVVSLGDLHETVEAAEEALRAYTQEALVFSPVERDLSYANEVYKARWNRALVIRDSDAIESEAELPASWFPPGHPRWIPSNSRS